MIGQCDACYTENTELKLIYDSFGVDVAATCIDQNHCQQKQKENYEKGE